MRFTIREARNMREITQGAMAKQLGICLHTYVKKENNPKTFTIWEVVKITEIFNIPYEQLIFLD